MKYRFLLLAPMFSFLLSGCFSSTKSEQKEYYLAQAAEVDNIQFIVNSVSDTKHIGSDYFTQDTEHNFVVLDITFKNIGTEEVTITDSRMNYYVGDNEYKPTNFYDSDHIYFYYSEKVAAGFSVTKKVVFETPDEHKVSDYLVVDDGGLFTKKSAKIWMKTA